MSRPISFNKALGTRTVASSKPIARIQYGSGDDAEARARQLSEMQRSLQQATDAVTAQSTPRYVEVYLPALTPTAVLCHKLGRRARFAVVRWTADTFGALANIVAMPHDDEANTLIVTAVNPGTAEIEVR